jgi:hypothetical protein
MPRNGTKKHHQGMGAKDCSQGMELRNEARANEQYQGMGPRNGTKAKEWNGGQDLGPRLKNQGRTQHQRMQELEGTSDNQQATRKGVKEGKGRSGAQTAMTMVK